MDRHLGLLDLEWGPRLQLEHADLPNKNWDFMGFVADVS